MKEFRSILALCAFLALSSCQLSPSDPGVLVPKTVDQDPDLPALDIRDTRLHLQTFGDPANPPLIFLHGGPGGDHRSLLRLKDSYEGYTLESEYFLVFYDQRGAGLSRRYGSLASGLANDVPELDLAQHVADLDAIVTHFAPNQNVILFGHSWGGMLATAYVNENADKVAAVILSEPGAFTSKNFTAGGVDLNFVSEGLNDAWWDLQLISETDHQTMDYGLINAFLTIGPDPASHFDLENDPMPFWRYGAVTSLLDQFGDYDFTTNLQAFSTKVLCINGSLNERLSVEFQETKNMVAYPRFDLETINGVGHDLMWKAAERHVEHIREYLNETL